MVRLSYLITIEVKMPIKIFHSKSVDYYIGIATGQFLLSDDVEQLGIGLVIKTGLNF